MKTLSKLRKLKPPKKIVLSELERKLTGAWKPVPVAELNNRISVKIVRFEGEYKWHLHINEDEFFIVLDGEALIQTELGDIPLTKGEGAIVHKGVKHCSKSEKGATVLVVEPIETKPLGDG